MALKDDVRDDIEKALTDGGVTVSIAGGPHVPLKNVAAALKKLKESDTPSTADKIAMRRDNLDARVSAPQSLTGSSMEKIRQFVARIETLETEKAELAEQLKEVFGEAKSLGFDTKALRAVVRIRKQNANDRAEAQMMLDLYLDAVGEI